MMITTSFGIRGPQYQATALLVGVSAALAVLCTGLNGGVFSYVLDDAYIHLALSENIRAGHYGVNPGEASSPASSILWPFLLAPFAGLPGHAYLPLLLNILATCGSVALVAGLLDRVGAAHWPAGKRLALFYVLLFLFVQNAFGLIFTGMEHSAQIMLTLCVVAGLYDHLEHNRRPWFLYIGIVAGPLIRYENLAISLGALLLLAATKRPLLAAGLGLVVAGLVGGFSLYLLELGLSPLPSSVLAKSAVGAKPSASAVETVLYAVAHLFRMVIKLDPSLITAIILALWLLVPLRRLWRGALPRTARYLCAYAVFCGVAHLAFGNYSWYGRYETYVYTVILSTELVAAAPRIKQRLTETAPRAVMLKMAAIYLLCLPHFWIFNLAVPIASTNIRDQQYEMHRFVTEFHRGAVAVNDLGWVTFRNPHYVLDLAGLAHAPARDARKELYPEQPEEYAAVLDRIVADRGVPLAMIYDTWFNGAVPREWVRLAVLRMEGVNVACGGDRVAFYACDPAQEAELRGKIRAFAATLPPGVYFDFPSPPEDETAPAGAL